MRRLNTRKEYEIKDTIEELGEQLKTEKEVSEKIRKFIEKKKEVISNKSDQREKLKEAKLAELVTVKEEIAQKKEDAEKEI